MAFAGYLLKLKGNGSTIPDVEFPMKYVEFNTYSATPNQRLEQKANRNGKGVLVRVTLSHMPYKVEFETVNGLTNETVRLINGLIAQRYTVEKERKLNIEYYDNENDVYKQATVYCPDRDYPIQRVDLTATPPLIYYNKLRYAFIEY